LEKNDLNAAFEHFSTNEIVVKPVIGANARDTFRLTRDTATSTTQQAIDAFRSQPAMLQPFVKAIVDVGEYSLFYFCSEFSHCVLKSPQAGDFRVQEEHGGLIRSCPPPPLLLKAGQRVINAIGMQLLYARVDFVYLSTDFPAVIELELIEPSLYFTYDERSPDRFAHALDRMYRAN
jgi:glutathione synthase/RimK-type ligase-like ATP-grasp enzyme